MINIDKYQRTTEAVKDSTLEENRRLHRQLAESKQSFELLKMVHFDKNINLEMLNDIIVGCTGCLYAMMLYNQKIITNLKEEHIIYKQLMEQKNQLTGHTDLFVSDDFVDGFTLVVYPAKVSEMIADNIQIKNIFLVFPKKFITAEVLEFVKSFMIVNEVLINIVLTREKMIELIEKDPLTGILNRSSWNANLEQLATNENAFFVVFLDIDNFKHINDNYGHQVGDDVLKETSQWLSDAFSQPSDRVYRLGGDEFAVTGGITLESIDKTLELLNNLNIDYTRRISKALGFRATLSIGASFVKNPHDAEMIYSKVDHLLYKSKEEGKDTIHIIFDF